MANLRKQKREFIEKVEQACKDVFNTTLNEVCVYIPEQLPYMVLLAKEVITRDEYDALKDKSLEIIQKIQEKHEEKLKEQVRVESQEIAEAETTEA